MSRRKTKCLTWGEMRRSGETLRDADGTWLAHISFATYVTMCGREMDDPHDWLPEQTIRRPLGVCRACWKQFKVDMLKLATYPEEHARWAHDGSP